MVCAACLIALAQGLTNVLRMAVSSPAANRRQDNSVKRRQTLITGESADEDPGFNGILVNDTQAEVLGEGIEVAVVVKEVVSALDAAGGDDRIDHFADSHAEDT